MNDLSLNHWTTSQKWLFRFLSAYVFWYIFPFPISYIPLLSGIGEITNLAWNNLGQFFGEHFFSLNDIEVKFNGSGDKTIDYLKNFSVLFVAIISAILWSILDRNRKNYDTLLYWVQVLVRYYLAVTLIGYGGAKIFKTQFPFPSLNRLVSTYGDSSPMGLAWTFMGYSTSFNYFTGFGEAIAGFLLFFRRTTLLGTFTGISVVSTIVAMNFGYDIPVKLFSSNLLLMLCLLLLPESKRLITFLFLNKEVEPKEKFVWTENSNLQLAGRVLKYGFIVFILYSSISGGLERVKKWGDQRSKPPLYGIYTAETVIIDNDTIPPLITDDSRWHQLIVNSPDRATIKTMNGQTISCQFTPDTVAQTITFNIPSNMDYPATLDYLNLPNERLQLKGILSSGSKTYLDTIEVTLQKKDLNDFLLINRGFNWINEYPYNR